MLEDKAGTDDVSKQLCRNCRNYILGKSNHDRCRRRHVCEKCGLPGHLATKFRRNGKGQKGKKGQAKGGRSDQK